MRGTRSELTFEAQPEAAPLQDLDTTPQTFIDFRYEQFPWQYEDRAPHDSYQAKSTQPLHHLQAVDFALC